MALVTYDNISSVQDKIYVDEVLGLARPKYRLRPLTRVIQIPTLTASIRIATTFTGQENVHELVEPDIKSQSYTTVDFDMASKGKNVVHVAMSWESELASNIDLMRFHIEDAAKELARMENSQIADAMAGATSVGTADWSSASVDPMDIIMDACQPIFNAGYNPTDMVMNYKTYGDLVSNDKAKDALERGTVAITGRLERFAGLRITVDENIPDETVYYLDPEAPALVLGEGPTMAVKYGEQDTRFVRGYAIAKFIEPKLVLGSAIRKHTYS